MLTGKATHNFAFDYQFWSQLSPGGAQLHVEFMDIRHNAIQVNIEKESP